MGGQARELSTQSCTEQTAEWRVESGECTAVQILARTARILRLTVRTLQARPGPADPQLVLSGRQTAALLGENNCTSDRAGLTPPITAYHGLSPRDPLASYNQPTLDLLTHPTPPL